MRFQNFTINFVRSNTSVMTPCFLQFLGTKLPIFRPRMSPGSCNRQLRASTANPATTDTSKINEDNIPPYIREIKFCQKCGSRMRIRAPEGDQHIRNICTSCGTIFYCNSKVVVGSVAVTEDHKRVLLCKRSIPPVGLWTIPAGYMESEESVEEGAAREAEEEASAKVKIGSLLACYSITGISQVQLLFASTLLNESGVQAGDETLEVGLFEWKDIPWDDLAYPTVTWALRRRLETLENENLVPQVRTKNPDGSFADSGLSVKR